MAQDSVNLLAQVAYMTLCQWLLLTNSADDL